MSIIKDGFCSKLTDEFDKRMKTLKAGEQLLNSKLNSLKLNLSTLGLPTPSSVMSQLKSNISNNMNKLVPNLDQFDEVVNLINSCSFAKKDSMLSKPSTLCNSLTSAIKGNTSKVLDEVAKVANKAIPEFDAGKLVNELKSQLKMGGVNTIIPQAKQLLDCMSAICGTDITGRMNSLNSYMSKFNINGSGELDLDALLASQNINTDLADNISDCTDQISNVMTSVEDQVSAGASKLKDTAYNILDLGD